MQKKHQLFVVKTEISITKFTEIILQCKSQLSVFCVDARAQTPAEADNWFSVRFLRQLVPYHQ